MCIFIEVAVAGYRGDAAQPFRERRLVAEPLTSEPGIPTANGTRLSVTDGHCACSVYAGNSAKTRFDDGEERGRYLRKGWSQSKIDRAIEAKRASHERPAREREHVNAFAAAIQELTAGGASLTLLASDVNSSFHISGTARLPLGEFVSRGGDFPQNTLVSIDR